MAGWVIGDVHGCWATLRQLLERIDWSPGRDRLWLIGDLVNKGPASLEVLRWAATTSGVDALLGNHDLHLLARAADLTPARADDRLGEVLAAPDRDDLLDWLRARPLLTRAGGSVLVHAGLMPDWSLEEAEELALAVAARIEHLLPIVASKPRPRWGEPTVGDERLAAAAAIFTRLRVVRADGRPQMSFTAAPEEAPNGIRPWFVRSRVLDDGHEVIFGHWAMMGYRRYDGAICLDSACVYGGQLTAISLDGDGVVHVDLADRVES